jgi:hypothetical protein
MKIDPLIPSRVHKPTQITKAKRPSIQVKAIPRIVEADFPDESVNIEEFLGFDPEEWLNEKYKVFDLWCKHQVQVESVKIFSLKQAIKDYKR